MKLKKSILFWSAILLVLFLGITGILSLLNLKLRVWVREPATLLIALGGIIGVFQLILHIKKKPLKIVLCILAAAATIAGGCWGYMIFAFDHLEEYTGTYNEKPCVIECENIMWMQRECYYEYHNPLVCGKEILNEDEY